MGVLQRFEDRLEQMISGAFARAFRSAVQPVEIAAALQREVDNSAQILSRDRRLVPNAFTVELSDADQQRLAPYGRALSDELTEMLHDHAREHSYVFTGPVSIELAEAADLTTGRFRVRSRAEASVSSAHGDPTDTQVRRADVVIEVNGMRHPVSPPGIVVGRGSDADLKINDPGVSRKHVELRVTDEGAEAIDLGSTNGMSVDGRRTAHADLSDGSVVVIGNTTITVHLTDSSGQGRSGDPGREA